jgi:polyisoprenoid-binding protein YceI
MKKLNSIVLSAAIILAAFFMYSCTEETEVIKEVEVPASVYTITGNVTYPDFTGTAKPAAGAVVYLKVNATEATTSYDMTTTTDATGNYTFGGLGDGSYFVFANYDTENTNNPGARMTGVIFGGEGGVVAIAGANGTQNVALASLGQSGAFAVNTFDGGDWGNDWSHSNIDFSFPYDDKNATYTGSFKMDSTYIMFDPFNLAGSKIEATIDVLTITTNSPGGRDPKYDTDGSLWQDAEGLYNLGCIHVYLGMENDIPTSANRYSTFKSTSIEIYGDGYLAKGDFTLNGVTAPVSMLFKFVAGFEGTNRGGDPVQFSSFEASFDFAAYQVYNVDSGHLGTTNDVTIDISLQVTKAL